jgi:HD-GYP domain-containing protein (c-di-GMP phosphodiesterase class II)
MSPMGARLRLVDFLAGLSISSDLGFGLPPEQSMRSALVATALARRLGMAEEQVADTLYATLLLHVGCTALAYETATTFGDEHHLMGIVARTNVADFRDIATKMVPEATRGLSPLPRARLATRLLVRGSSFARMYDTGSCEVGSAVARRIGLGEGIQRSLYEIAEWWNGGGAPTGLRGDEIALPARVARVGTDAALFDVIAGGEAAVDAVEARAGGMADPSIVRVFAAHSAELLATARNGDPRDLLLAAEPEPVLERDESDLPELARAFGDLADLGVTFTHGHAAGVARLAVGAASIVRLDGAATARLEIAALLHDIGRVGVTNVIWQKPGPLTAAEWEQVRMHAYHSERILATSHTLEPMATLAGMHHERLDGSGYHRGCTGRDLAPAARILAAADAFQAMTQERPHRPALSVEQAADELAREARAGRLDADCVSAVLDAAGQRHGRRSDLRPAGLTERELEVLALVAIGCSNAEIAKRLVISRRTAEHHVQHIYGKLGVASRAAVALFAVEHDLVPSAH